MRIKTQDIGRAVKDIQKLDADLRKLGTRATPDIVGFYGELLAWKELKKYFGWRGYKVEFGSGQSRADIVLLKKDQTVNIEVKTSRPKEEWYGLGYGYALNIKKCKKHPDKKFNHPKKGKVEGDFCYFDYLVAVLLSEDLLKYEFYVFDRNFINEHEKGLRNKNLRFSSSTHRMIFIDKIEKSKQITQFDLFLRKGRKRFLNNWKTIK